jgi:CheY-like chemotaxis protein
VVLVVDDVDVVRRVARVALEMRGYTVLLAENGREAVELVRRRGADLTLILHDMTMPVMSGEEAMDEIAGLAPGVPVIASSGYDEKEAVRRFANRPVAGFLQKPYTSRQLAEKVKAVLEASGQ